MESLTTIFGDIGNVLGYPAMLLIFWLYNKVKENTKRLEDGERRFHEQEKETDEIKESIGAIHADVSFIRGFIEGKSSVKKEDE
jgi:hypothetical protein